jgi:hypothetical protein
VTTKSSSLINFILALLLCYALAAYATMHLRFLGNWSEGDSLVVTRAVSSSDKADSLRNAAQPYPNGVGYVSIVLFLEEITGVQLQTLQMYIMPCIAAFNVLVLFVGYRAMTRVPLVALLAALFAYLQPDFLWVTWRGSHEKFTWMLVIALIFVLARSFSTWNQPRLLTRFVILFYIIAFAMISSNVFFASSFVVAILLSFTGANVLFLLRQFVQRRRSQEDQELRRHIQRLVYINIAVGVLFYIFIFHLYPDSLSALSTFKTLVDQLALLFLNVEEQQIYTTTEQTFAAPSVYVRASWLSLYVFVGLTIFSWLMLLSSFIVWAIGVLGLIRKPTLDHETLPRLFLWLIYPAFALQVAGAILADRVAVLSANLQVRLFTPAMLTAIPLAALGAYTLIQNLSRVPKFWRQVLVAGAGLAVFYFSVASIFKATNEPMLNNNFIFVTTPEYTAGDWAATHLKETTVWTGSNDRVAANLGIRYLNTESSNEVEFRGFGFSEGTRYFLLSEMERAVRVRSNLPPPFFIDQDVVYDNGSVQIFHRTPLTPYQQ